MNFCTDCRSSGLSLILSARSNASGSGEAPESDRRLPSGNDRFINTAGEADITTFEIEDSYKIIKYYSTLYNSNRILLEAVVEIVNLHLLIHTDFSIYSVNC